MLKIRECQQYFKVVNFILQVSQRCPFVKILPYYFALLQVSQFFGFLGPATTRYKWHFWMRGFLNNSTFVFCRFLYKMYTFLLFSNFFSYQIFLRKKDTVEFWLGRIPFEIIAHLLWLLAMLDGNSGNYIPEYLGTRLRKKGLLNRTRLY